MNVKPMSGSFHLWQHDALAAWDRHDALLTSPALVAPPGCRELIPSWGLAETRMVQIEVQLRARFGARWSAWYRIARWSALARSSYAMQRDADGFVATDTLCLQHPADAVQARVMVVDAAAAFPAALRFFALWLGGAGALGPAAMDITQVPPIALPLHLSQYAYPEEAGWCSPTAVAIVLAYWQRRRGDPRLLPFAAVDSVPQMVAPGVFDPSYDGTGNWSFNTAFAARFGLLAYVTRLQRLEQVARWLAAGVPLIVSIAWQQGELTNAAIPRSAGHLLVVTGIADGQVVTADPAGAQVQEVERVYPAEQFLACWQRGSGGTVYLMYPPTWPAPLPGEEDAWA
jgi:hypothetical protein